MIRTFIAFTPLERRVSIAGSLIVGLRLLSLFLVLPTFSIYALGLMYATPENVSLALGFYGLAAMIMQPVFGYLSDKYGRLRMITIGLVLLMTGSLIAAFASTIYTMMLARLLQGCGAITGVTLALIADHTRPQVRSEAMALVSTVMSIAFMLAIALSPILVFHMGLSGLFVLTAILSLLAVNLLMLFPKHTANEREHLSIHLRKLKLLLKNRTVLLFYLSIFLLSAILIATFVILPSLFLQNLNLSPNQSWWLYVISLSLAFIFMLIIITLTEKFKLFRRTLLLSVMCIIFAELLFMTNFTTTLNIVLPLTLFFTGFMTLETLLPSWLTRIVAPDLKGAALGFYASAEFFGAFIGGVTGAFFTNTIANDTFLYILGICVFWFLALSTDLRKLPQ